MAKKETVRVQGGAAEGLRDKASSHLPLTLKWLRKEGLPVLLPREGNLRGNLLRVVGTQVSAGENLHNKKCRVDSVDLSPLRALPWTPTAPSCPGRLCSSFPAGFLTPLLLALTSIQATVHVAARLASPKPEPHRGPPGSEPSTLALGTKFKFLKWPARSLLPLQAQTVLNIEPNAPPACRHCPYTPRPLPRDFLLLPAPASAAFGSRLR